MRGGDKLMEEIGGEPLLRRAAREALGTGLPVIVALRPERAERTAALDGLPVERVFVPDADQGMSASLRAAVAEAPDEAPLAVLLADMPEIRTEDLIALIDAFEDGGADTVVRAASEDGLPGQPVIFPARLRPDLLAVAGDAGGREILRRESVRLVPLPGRRALTDLDTPEEFAAWRAGPEGPAGSRT
jgi:CTP:molybdopterin cytidylyltransferase MocA